jgi:outer membrane protein assembly complex protein YaeT
MARIRAMTLPELLDNPTPAAPSMEPGGKRRFHPVRGVLIAAAAIILVVAVLLVLVRLGSFDRLILSEAAGRLEAATGLRFEAKGISVDPFSLAVRIEAPSLSAPPGQGRALRRFAADEVFVDVPWSVLAGGRLRLQKVRVVRPAVFLAAAPEPAGEGVEQRSPAAAAGSPAAFDLRIDDLVVQDGSETWSGATGSLSVSLRGTNLEVRYQALAQAHAVVLSAVAGRLDYGDRSLDLTHLALRGRIDARDIRVDALDLSTERSSFSFAGTISDYPVSPRFEGRGRVSLAVGEIPFPPRYALVEEGLLTGVALVKSSSGQLVYDADLTTEGLVIRDLGRASLDLEVRGDADGLDVSRLDLRTDAGAVKGTFRANLTRGSVDDADLQWTDLDLDRIAAVVPFAKDLPTAVGSLASGRLKGKADPLTRGGLSGSLALTLVPHPETGIRLGDGRSPLRPSGEIAIGAAEGEFRLDRARLTAAGATLEASGVSRADGRLDGRFALRIESLSATLGTLRRAGLVAIKPGGLPAGLEDLEGSLSVAGTLGGRFDAPAVTAEIDAPQLRLSALHGASLRADLEADASEISVRSLSGDIAGGSIRGSGTIALPGSRVAGISDQFVLDVEGVDLAPLSALMPAPWNRGTAGLFKARAEIKTGTRGLSAAFSSEVTGLALAGLGSGPRQPAKGNEAAPAGDTGIFRLSALKLRGKYSLSGLEIEELVAETKTGAISGHGGIEPKNGTFAAILHSDGFDLETIGPLMPAALGLAGRAVFDLDAGGDVRTPRGSLTLAVTDLRVGRLAVAAIDLEAASDGTAARASVRLPEYNARLEGTLALSPPFALKGQATVAGLPLGRLLGRTPEPAAAAAGGQGGPSGSLFDLDITFTYPLSDPSGFTADVVFSGKDISFGAGENDLDVGAGPPLLVGIAGRVLASGDPSSAASIRLDGEISRFLAALGEESISNASPLRIRLDDGSLRIDPFTLAGTAGSLTAGGTFAPIQGRPTIAGNLRADLDLAILAPFLSGMTVGGRLRADVDVRGNFDAPALAGRILIADGLVRAGEFPLILNGVAAEFSIDGPRFAISKFDATANGSPVHVGGSLEGLFGAALPSGSISVEARSLPLEYPPGLHTTSDIALTLSGAKGGWTLSGSMKVLRGLFREDISPGGSILGFGSYRWAQSESELPPAIRDIGLDIAVSTVEPIVFRNNLADLDVQADVRVSGNPGLPLFSGRLYNDGAGTITFGERRFTLETARIDLLGQRVPDPNVEIVASIAITHDQELLDIRLRLYGPASDLRYSLTSTPARSKEDLSLIILTGQSLEEVRGNAVNTLTAQTLNFFASPIASPVTGTLERLLKAEDVSFTPLLVSAETDPGARFTFRKKISEDVQVVYSLDITSTQNQTLLLDYRLKRNFSLQAFQKDNGSYGASLRHSIPLRLWPDVAGAGTERGAARPILSSLTLEGDPKLPPKVVDSALRRLRRGKPFSYPRLNDAKARLIKAYRKRGFANADVRPDVTTSEDGRDAAVRLNFAPGLPVRIAFRGDAVSSRTRRTVRKNWTGLLPEDINLDDARSLVLKRLRRKGYYEARVETEKHGGDGESLYEITVAKGPRYKVRNLTVTGNTVLTEAAIRKAASAYPLAPYKGLWNLVYDPRAALDAVAAAYRASGYTDARIRRLGVVDDPAGRTVDIRLGVTEGPRRTVHKVAFSGLSTLPESELRRIVQTSAGNPFDPSLPPKDRDALLAFCRSQGLLEAEIRSDIKPHAEGPDVDVIFEVREGPVHTVSALQVQSAGKTRAALVLRTAGIKKGDVFSFEALAAGQKRLYDLGVFRAVDISAPESPKGSTGVPVLLDVREEPPLTFTYGLRYSSEDKLEGQVGLSMVNILGGGRTALASYRLSGRLWDARVSINLPYAFGYRADTRLSLSTTRETREAYISDEVAGSIGQEIKFGKNTDLNLVYKLSRVREKAPDEAAFGPSLVLSELLVSAVRDTRDDRFDAKTGSFLSLSLTGAPRVFGSELPYVRAFTQYSFYREAWGRLRWASNVRFGATTAFGADLPASRLFYAGGGTSLRGFKQDMVGPLDPGTGLPAGGKLVLLVNQELRFPIFPFLSGVVFYDAGNVYASLRAMGRFDLRQGVGAGLRLQSPIGLVRFDYGINPFPRLNEPKTVLFLSIGQAF